MTNGYVINIGDASAKQWASFAYEKTLNAMSNCQIGLDGVTSGYSAEFEVDKEIFIYKNGTLKFRGKVGGKKDLSAGGVVLTSVGIEEELADDKCPMVGNALVRTFTSTTDNSIIDTLVASVTGWTVDITNSSAITPSSFRVAASESVWNGVIRLIEQVGKDIKVDQANKKIYLYDELTSNDAFSFIEGKNAQGITRNKLRSKAGKVIVYGKGDGDFQIVGTSGASTPVHTIIDRNIVSTTEANARALVEYNKLNPNPKRYHFTPTYAVDTLEVGDMGNINNNSAGIDEEVDIVRLKTTVDGNGVEKVDLEVTNPDFRLASKNAAESNAQGQAGYNQSQSSMQGSGNTQSWSRGINAKSGVPLTVPFYVSSDFVEDEAGNIRIDSLTLDYDVDPYRPGVGSATESNKEPSLAAVTAAASHGHSPYEVGSHDHRNPSVTSGVSAAFGGSEGSDTYAENVGASWDLVATEGYSGTFDCLYAEVTIEADSWSGTDTIGIELRDGSTVVATEMELGFKTTVDPMMKTFVIPMFVSTSGTIYLYLYSTGTQDYKGKLQLYGGTDHTHNVAAYDTGNETTALDDANQSPLVTGKTALHKHDVSVGDDVTENEDINATEVDIYLDHYENKAITNNETAGSSVVIEMADTGNIDTGDIVYFNGTNKEWATVSAVTTNTSITATIATNKSAGDKITWVNKHSIINTGKTIDTGVDITDSNSYPDVVGFWRVRIDPNHASPDLVQGVIRMRHHLDA